MTEPKNTDLQRLAAQGFSPAQYNLGFMYENAQGVPQSYNEAAKWYHLSAIQGYPDAQLSLGVMYEKGHGVPQSDRVAVEWFQKAAEQGHTDAQNALEFLEN